MSSPLSIAYVWEGWSVGAVRNDDAGGNVPPQQPRWIGPAFDRDRIITFSTAESRNSFNWQLRTKTAGELLAILLSVRVGKKGEGLVWAPSTFDGGQRKASAALGTFVATFDSDGGTPLAELELAAEMTGWHIVIVPSSSWGSTVSEISGDAFDAWAKDTPGGDIERYLVEVLQKTPAVAAGAVIEASFDQIEQTKDGQTSIRRLLRIRHNPCEKYRLIAFLSQRFDLSTTQGRRAWKRYYDAMCDVLAVPLDRTSGSPERLLYQSRLPAELIGQAREHIRVVAGGTIEVSGLPEPKPRVRTRRGPASFRDEQVLGRGSDQDELEYRWIDPLTGTDIDLRKWSVSGMSQLPLADVLREGSWPLDDRGEQDGKLHIDCPFIDQHTSLSGGGTYVANAADFERTGMVDRRRGAIIHCSHNSCKDRDRLEFISEFLRRGALTTAHLYAARDAAKALELAADFEPIEDDTPVKPIIKPSFEWTRETIESRLPQLKRLSLEDAEAYASYRQGWDIADTISADELDLLVDLAANDDERIEPPPPGDSQKPGKDTFNWRSKLIRSEKGVPNTGTKNLMLTLEHGLGLGACVGFNLLKQRVEIRDPGALGWGHKGEKARPWADRDDTLAASLAEDELQGVIKPHSITPIIEAVAWKHAFHPVRDYLNGVVWDGIPRIDTMLIDHAQVEDTPYARAVSARTLIGAVARIMKPGAKVDTALILESAQGSKKSSLFAALAVDPQYFTDNLPGHLGDKSVAEIIAAYWFVELAELTNLKKGDVDKIKAFLSRTSDSFRPAYGRRVVDHPRQCIFAGTVNGETIGYLRDLTGNRRFWTLKCGRINLAQIAKIRDQLWAEAVARYAAGERWWFDDDTEGELIEAQRQATSERTEEPELTEVVRRFLTHKPGVSGFDQDVMSAWTKRKAEITVIPSITSFYNAIGKVTSRITFSDKVAFKQALQALGWKVKQQRASDESLLGLSRGARYFVAPEADLAVSMARWVKLQLRQGAVAGQDDVPRLEDDNVVSIKDRKKP